MKGVVVDILLLTLVTLTLTMSIVEKVNSRVKRGNVQSNDCQKADIIFVLDSSGSIGKDNWFKVLDFVKTVVQDFPIGKDNIRVGVTTYGNRASINFHLDAYFDQDSLLLAIDNISWKDEMTNTSGGIRTMYHDMFREDKGDRKNVPNIGLVITDGESNKDPDKTIPEANNARSRGIVMIALGIGDQVKQSELEGIANTIPNPVDSRTKYVFQADNFDSLPIIREQLVAAACESQSACSQDGDILFILDASDSIGHSNFMSIKTYVQKLVNSTNVVDDGARIGLIIYNNAPKLVFQLGTHKLRSDVNDEIKKLNFVSGISGTDTAAALSMARTQVYNSNMNRANKHDIIVLFTDGGSDDYGKTIDEARQLRMQGVDILVIAIGNWLNMIELNEIATDPDNLNVLVAPKATDLDTFRLYVKASICRDIISCGSDKCKNGGTCIETLNSFRCICPENYAGLVCDISCSKKSDVVFVMDESASIGEENFYLMQEFAKSLVRHFNVRDNTEHTRFGMETFGNNPTMRFRLNTYKNNQDAANAISFVGNMGQTNTAGALRMMRTSMFNENNGDRGNMRNVGILMSDGRSNDRQETFNEAMLSHNAGIYMVTVAVGVTHSYDILELEGIASDPNDHNIFYTANYTTLQSIAYDVVTNVCDEENSCASLPCKGEAQCIDKLGEYQCRCRSSRTGINCERSCSGIIDVVFMVDSSGSIRRHRFKIFKDFVKSLITEMDIRPDRTRVGLLTFNEDISIVFNLNTYNTKEDLLQAVERIEWVGGRTHIAEALRMTRTLMFVDGNGDRNNAPNLGILITDGQATVNAAQTLPEAIEARVAGIHLIVVAAEHKTPTLELKGIASDPDSANLFYVNKFSDMTSDLTKLVIGATCDDEDECRSGPCRNGQQCVDGLNQYICFCTGQFTGVNCERTCSKRVDVAFILDASGSLEQEFDMQMELTKLIVQGLNFDVGRTRVAVTTFSDSAQIRFTFNAFTDKQSVLNAIAFDLEMGKTNTADALRITRQDVFSTTNGNRIDPDYVIVMSDGESNINPGNTVPQASQLKNDQGVTLISVGIGKNFNRPEIDGMASTPLNQHSFQLASTSDMPDVANSILDTICQ